MGFGGNPEKSRIFYCSYKLRMTYNRWHLSNSAPEVIFRDCLEDWGSE